MSRLNCQRWPVHTDLSRLTYSLCPFQGDLSGFRVILSWLTFPANLSRLTSPGWTASANLSSLKSQADLSRLMCPC